jgi:hypothetical protein
MRGGSEAPKKKSKKVKKGKSKPTSSRQQTEKSRSQINQVLKETDAAQALGDAIRARANVLRQDTWASTPSVMVKYNPSLASLAWSLGASDYSSLAEAVGDDGSLDGQRRRSVLDDEGNGAGESTIVLTETTDDDSGGVEVAPGAVVASYFLKSHGGAHALQSLCSLLSATAGLGAVALAQARQPPSSARAVMSLNLLKRSLLFALVKHVSGLLAASWIAARAIPEVGFVRARSWIQQLALDPVSQYSFYTALVLVWLPCANDGNDGGGRASAAAVGEWWFRYPMVTLLLLGPILLREVISTAFVICDVLVLLSLSPGGITGPGSRLLRVASAVVNAGFSLIVTPRAWRGASAAERQKILARLVQKCSLAFEVAVGALMLADAFRGVLELLFAAQRPYVTSVVKRCVCTNLYLQFLLTRRRKIRRLASQVRGGAAQLPVYVLDVLLDPRGAIGVQKEHEDAERSKLLAKLEERSLTWRDYLTLALEQDF